MLALAATRFCSACRMSGRRCSSADGRSAGISGATSWSIVLPRGIGPGLRPSRIEIRFSCAAICCSMRGNRGERLLVLRLDLRHFGLRHDAGLEAQVEDPRGLAEVRRRRLRDLELPVERAQRDVARRDARHQRQHDAALRLLARIDLRLRGFGQAPHAAEQVELPRRAERRLVQREVAVHAGGDRRLADAARLGAARVGAVADLRQQLRARAVSAPMNWSTRAAAMRTSRFSRSAVSISSFSTGSPNCSHHFVLATSAAFG